MSITHKTDSHASGGLVCPALISMAAKGFDLSCLVQIQTDAFRAAAQAILHQSAKNVPFSANDLRDIVNKYLCGEKAPVTYDEVTHNHIAGYMQSKTLMIQAYPRHLVRNAKALSMLRLPEPEYGKHSQDIVTSWLAHYLNAIARHATHCDKSFPMFAQSMRELVRQIETVYLDKQTLRTLRDQLLGNEMKEMALSSSQLHQQVTVH